MSDGDPAPVDEVVWLPFAGTAARRGDGFRLTAQGGNGAIELGEADIGFDQARKVYVRQGAVLRHVEEPSPQAIGARPAPDAVAALCPGGLTGCIGTVLFCCGDFRVLGSASGAWGCARLFRP